MLVVKINRANFEYDVNAIVQSFFPEETVKVLTPETGEAKRNLWEKEIRMEVEVAEDGAKMTCSPDLGGVRHGPVEAPKAAPVEASLVVFSWRYDAVKEEGLGLKNGFKRFLYRSLEELTGRKLPWGALTGIRPTKIAYALLEQGKSEAEILAHYQERYYAGKEKSLLAIEIAKRERDLLSSIGTRQDGDRGKASDEGGIPYDASDDGNGDRISDEGGIQTGRNYDDSYSLYIGIPFCPTTCLYCSFPSFSIGAYRKRVDEYLECLLSELEYVSGRYRLKRLDTVYIGGGTPTTLDEGQLGRLLGRLRELFDFSTVKEFTVEAGRADSITWGKLMELHRHGVTRISINPQTMNQETLKVIGRAHTVEQVAEAYHMARQAGFDNINMDIILGLPGEGPCEVQNTVDRIVELAPDSLTVHSLAIKRSSRLSQWILENGVSTLKNTDETMAIAAKGAAALGMNPYYLYRQKNMSGNFENVGYAKPGKYGLYNILIMEEVQTIIACGAGSITKVVRPDGCIQRAENVKEVALYLEKIDEMIERKRRLLLDNA